MGRQVITTVDRVAGSCPEIPIVHFAEGDIFQDAGGKIFQTDRTFLFQVDGIEALRVGGAFAEINQFGSCFGNRKIREDILFSRDGEDFPG